jgi:outer membrane protein insertion porin family
MMSFILLLISFMTFASTDFTLKEVVVNCKKSEICSQRTLRFKSLEGDYRSLVHLKDTLRVMASDGGYQSFDYVLLEEEGTNTLKINFTMKPIIQEINIGFADRNLEFDPMQLITFREGDFYESQKLEESLEGVHAKLDAMGFPDNKHTSEVLESSGTIRINIAITLGSPRIFKSVVSNSKSLFVKNYLKRKFLNFYNKPFDVNSFKTYLDEAQKELFNYGYYLISLNFTPVYKGKRVSLRIKVTHDYPFAFDFRNLKRENRDVVHALLVDVFRKFKRPLSDSAIKNTLKDHYRSKALLNAEFKVETSEFKNSSNEEVHLYRIYFDEQGKTRLVNVTFLGNSFFKSSKLHNLFHNEAFELASINYYDEEYFDFFQDYLKNLYVEKGFVQAKVFDPVKVFDSAKKVSSVEYTIQEGQRAFVTKILFEGLPAEFDKEIIPLMWNKLQNAFNPIKATDDIKTVATFLQEKGYYYAEVSNANDNSLVTYNRTATEVTIKFKIDPGPLVKLNRILYMGNDKTKKRVLSKKILFQKGDIISPSKTREIESVLSATGLFNSVNVTPLRHNSKNAATDLLVRVTEREYGLVEIAPGYRTDLGLKLTGTLSYQNIGGYNQAVTFRSQVNRRTSYTTLDPERRDDLKNLIEHNTSITYTKGDIFDTLIDGSSSVSYQTRRFYKFDADIFRINGTLSRDLTRQFSASLKYQYEDIEQYNATDIEENGKSHIGSITPSLTYDLRNSQVNPQRGAFFNISSEFANPYLGSQKTSDATINYLKIMMRNRFYIPFKNGTLAISLTSGIQENLARDKVIVNGNQQTEG